MNISDHLRDLGYRPLGGGAFNVDAEFATSLLNERGRFPEDYETFLRDHPLTGVFDSQVGFEGSEKSPWASGDGEILECLYGQCPDKRNDLKSVWEQLSNELPSDMLPIGQVTGANFVCISLNEAAFGTICLWDHEHMDDARHGIYTIAPSFHEFVKLLKRVEARPVEGRTKLVRMEISEALKARVARLNKSKGK